MDKKTRDFFEEVVEKEGSPVFAGKMPPKDSEFWLASKIRAFWNFLRGNGKSKKHKAEVAPTVSAPKEEPKQTEVIESEDAEASTTPTEQEEQQESNEEEKLIETFEKAHPEEVGKTQLSK